MIFFHDTHVLVDVWPAKDMNTNFDTSDHLGEIYEWIDQIKLSRPKKNIARDFSDGVLMAELLKRYYPKQVDVHNYVAGNSVAKKIDNWCTLNRKVLSKIDMKLGKEVINRLANSQSGVIEKVLADLRAKIVKDSIADRDSLYSSDNKETMKQANEVENKTVPRQVFIRLKQELEEKNDAIATLQQKILHLENIMRLKDQRIEDLTSQIMHPLEPRNAMTIPFIIDSSKMSSTNLLQ